jgi:hypothetical protein
MAGEGLAQGGAGGEVPDPDAVVQLALTIFVPSGVTATELIQWLWPVRGSPKGAPVARSHTRMVASLLPLTILVPSGVTATDSRDLASSECWLEVGCFAAVEAVAAGLARRNGCVVVAGDSVGPVSAWTLTAPSEPLESNGIR